MSHFCSGIHKFHEMEKWTFKLSGLFQLLTNSIVFMFPCVANGSRLLVACLYIYYSYIYLIFSITIIDNPPIFPYQSDSPSIYKYTCPSIFPSIYLSIYLYIYLLIYLLRLCQSLEGAQFLSDQSTR